MEDTSTSVIDTAGSTEATSALLAMYARRVPDNDEWPGLNLDLVWRFVGSPEGRSPRAWAERSRGLIASFAAYLRDNAEGYPALDSAIARETGGVLRRWSPIHPEPSYTADWSPSDVLTSHVTVGMAYSAWLDSRADDERGPHAVESFLSL